MQQTPSLLFERKKDAMCYAFVGWIGNRPAPSTEIHFKILSIKPHSAIMTSIPRPINGVYYVATAK